MSDNISPRQPAIMGVVCIYLLVVGILYILQYVQMELDCGFCIASDEV